MDVRRKSDEQKNGKVETNWEWLRTNGEIEAHLA